ncbi:hypothetical protein A2U01_0033413, partial [Trifolium medium]|nr:hypothetical protein [Trifolium medium]
MGWERDDEDGWTEVRSRRRRERRQVNDGIDSPRQFQRHRSITPSRRRAFSTEHYRDRYQVPDFYRAVSPQSRYSPIRREPRMLGAPTHVRSDVSLQYVERRQRHGDRRQEKNDRQVHVDRCRFYGARQPSRHVGDGRVDAAGH